MIYQWFSEFFCMKDTYLKTKIKKKILLYDLRILYTFLQTLEKSSLHDYRIKNILHYEKEKNRPSENERESRREKEREREGEGLCSVKEARPRIGGLRRREAEGSRRLRRKDTSSLGAKKRNGHSPARWRKVGRSSQPLTGAKETTLRAIADSCPLGRASRERETGLLFPLLSPPRRSSLFPSPRQILFYTLYVPLPRSSPSPLRTGPGKLPRTIFRNGNFSSLGLESNSTRRGIDSLRLDKTPCRVLKIGEGDEQRWSSRWSWNLNNSGKSGGRRGFFFARVESVEVLRSFKSR